jgi:hypothetical protein
MGRAGKNKCFIFEVQPGFRILREKNMCIYQTTRKKHGAFSTFSKVSKAKFGPSSKQALDMPLQTAG